MTNKDKLTRIIQRCDFANKLGDEILSNLKPCTSIDCDKGKALVEGTTRVQLCPICGGTGSVVI